MSKHPWIRQNAKPDKPVLVSPGPTSIEGKAISSKNATKHGCCADETLILAGRESMQDYEALETLWLEAYSPQDDAEKHLVDQLVLADWFHRRATRTVAEIEARLFAQEPDPLLWSEQQNRNFGRFLRYQTTRANNLKRATKAVEDYLKNRAAEENVEEKMAIAKERLEVYKIKNKPKPTIQETLTFMLEAKKEADRLKQQNP